MAGMERLTHRYTDGEAWTSIYKVSACGEHECKGPIIERLAAYEDTGLEPEEVVQTKLALMGKVLAEIKEFDGVPVNRMIELAQAEKDGRLVVLPCKPDEIFYQWKRGDDCPSVSRFEGVEISEDGEITYPMKRWGEAFTLDDFGKTIFLSRADAKAALAAQKE